MMTRLAKEWLPRFSIRRFRLRFIVGLCILLPGIGEAKEPVPTLEELVSTAEAILKSYRAGHIRFRTDNVALSDEILDKMMQNQVQIVEDGQKRMLAEFKKTPPPENIIKQRMAYWNSRMADAVPFAKISYFQRYSGHMIEMGFDRAQDACWVASKTLEDWKDIIKANDIGKLGTINFRLSVRSVRVGDAMVKDEVFLSKEHHRVLHISMGRGLRLPEEMEILEKGLLLRSVIAPLRKYHHKIKMKADGMLELKFSTIFKPKRIVITLDPSIGFRMKEVRISYRKKLVRHDVYSYCLFGDTVFLSKSSITDCDGDGKPFERETYEVLKAEFPNSLDPSEFLVDLPADVPVRDSESDVFKIFNGIQLDINRGHPARVSVETIMDLMTEAARQEKQTNPEGIVHRVRVGGI